MASGKKTVGIISQRKLRPPASFISRCVNRSKLWVPLAFPEGQTETADKRALCLQTRSGSHEDLFTFMDFGLLIGIPNAQS